MKANRKFSKDEEAVSPVIGVILMVAITVILAAVIAAFVFGMGGNLTEAPPSVSLTASSNSATGGADDLIIKHIGGEPLIGSDWKFSVVPEGNTSAYVTTYSDDDFEVGMQLIVETRETTERTTTSFANWKYADPDGDPLTAGKYSVQVVHIPSNSMVLDTIVDVR